MMAVYGTFACVTSQHFHASAEAAEGICLAAQLFATQMYEASVSRSQARSRCGIRLHSYLHLPSIKWLEFRNHDCFMPLAKLQELASRSPASTTLLCMDDHDHIFDGALAWILEASVE